jgi:PAS domain S-box-containing protein
MTDIVLETVRAIVLAIIVIFLWNSGQNRFEQSRTDWNLIVFGFGLLLFGSILDITDNFEGLNPYIVVGDTQTEAFLEKVVGFIGGFIFISIGLFNWIPTVQGLSDLVDTRTRDLQEINNSLVTEVDSRKRAEETLRLSEERYRNLVETSHDLIWSVDSEGKFTFVNRNAAMHILGYEPGEMIGRSLAYFKTPEQAEEDLKTFSRIKETGGASHYETSYRKKDGSFVDMSFNAVVVKDSKGNLMGTMGTAQDISQRKRAEERLSQSEETKRALFAAATDSIFLLNRTGTVLEVNEAGAKSLGASVGDMVGRNIFEFMPPEVGDRRRGKLLAMLESKEPNVDEDGRDGSWFETHAQPILDARGEVQRIALFSRDITKRKRADEQLQRSQKMQAVGQLTGGIAHEFNNILTVVISNLDILDRGDLNENDASTLMQHSTDAAYRGAKLTKQLLAFSRREMLRPEILQTNDLILDEVDFLRPTLGDEITIEAYRAEDLELIEVDRQLLGNAILNLALNARTAMPEGGTLTIETANFNLEEELFDEDGGLPSGRYVMLTVIDTGYGMSPDVLEHAFEPFFTTKGLAEGSGLGLSMVYGFVKQSGGHVTIESEEGKGTTVRLFFPVVRGVAEEKKTDAKDKGRRPIGKKTVLVVENDEAIRNMLVIVLNSLGLETHEAEDGLEALEALDRVSHIDLLFTDVVLSDGMSGTELAHEARDRDRDIKVLLTSGYSEQALAREGKLDEEFDLFPKPYSITELVERLRTVLEG